jgi:hypothetical protein
MKVNSSILLKLCVEDFSDNAYVIKYKERTLAAMESTNILQEKDDGNISFEKHIDEEENEEAIVPTKLVDVWDLTPSPPTYDSKSKTENSIVMDDPFNGTYYYSDESDYDMPMACYSPQMIQTIGYIIGTES